MNVGIFYKILSVPHNIVMDLNNVMHSFKACPFLTTPIYSTYITACKSPLKLLIATIIFFLPEGLQLIPVDIVSIHN